MTYQFHEFYKYKEVKSRKVFIFQAKVLKFGDLLVGGSWQQMQNSRATSQKLCQLIQKDTGRCRYE